MRLTPRTLQQHWDRYALRPKSISFIGLGRMGSEMAFNLFAKTHAVSPDMHFVVCDAVPDAAGKFCDNFSRSFSAAKIGMALTPEEAVLASRTVVTMLPSSPQVRSVYTEAGGMLPALRMLMDHEARGTLFIDSTTLDVHVGREVASEARAAGADMVDAPVSGGVAGAKAGTLSFLVGGPEASFNRASPLLAHMGGRILHCGPSGAGLAAKICNNLVLGVEQIVVAEAMLLGQRLGLDARVLADVIGSSTGACWACSTNNPVPGALADKSPPCERGYEGGFATALMVKDLGLASEAGSEASSPLPLAEAAGRIYAEATKRRPELNTKDFSSVYEYLRGVSEDGRRIRLGPLQED